MNPQDPAAAPITLSVFLQSRTESPVLPPHEGPVCPALSIPWDGQGFEARQPNVIHLYLLVLKLSWDEQAESGKLSLSVCHSDPFELLQALCRSRPPPEQRLFLGWVLLFTGTVAVLATAPPGPAQAVRDGNSA